MGFFSFITQDTNESIPNSESILPTFTVYMVDNNNTVYTESNYEGYGEFGGKDFFQLIAEMNGFDGSDDEKRDKGNDLYYSDEEFLSPNFYRYQNKWKNEKPKECENQGYFYHDSWNEDLDEDLHFYDD